MVFGPLNTNESDIIKFKRENFSSLYFFFLSLQHMAVFVPLVSNNGYAISNKSLRLSNWSQI